ASRKRDCTFDKAADGSGRSRNTSPTASTVKSDSLIVMISLLHEQQRERTSGKKDHPAKGKGDMHAENKIGLIGNEGSEQGHSDQTPDLPARIECARREPGAILRHGLQHCGGSGRHRKGCAKSNRKQRRHE